MGMTRGWEVLTIFLALSCNQVAMAEKLLKARSVSRMVKGRFSFLVRGEP